MLCGTRTLRRRGNALLTAERRFHELLDQARQTTDSAPLVTDAWAEVDVMVGIPAKTLAGAAAKLRVVLDPEVGMVAGPSDCTMPMLIDILAVVERLADRHLSASRSRARAAVECLTGGFLPRSC